MALITAAEARLVIDAISGIGEDTNLDTLISAAGGLLASWCRYPPASAGAAASLESATYTIYLDGPDPLEPRRLRLPVRPITAVTSIHDDASGDWSFGASDLVDSGQYSLISGDRGEIWLNPNAAHAWGKGQKVLKVVCTAGFTTIPDDIKQACRSAVKWMWDRRRNEGVSSVSFDGATEQFARPAYDLIPDQARMLLQPYRLWGGAFG